MSESEQQKGPDTPDHARDWQSTCYSERRQTTSLLSVS